MSGGPQPTPPLVGARTDGCVKEKGEREREKTWVFPSRTIDELKSLERGRAAADTPMLIQDFGASLSMAIQNNVVPMSIRDDESLCLEISFFKKTFFNYPPPDR